MHAGLDFARPVGAPILAAAKGKVTFVGTKTVTGKSWKSATVTAC